MFKVDVYYGVPGKMETLDKAVTRIGSKAPKLVQGLRKKIMRKYEPEFKATLRLLKIGLPPRGKHRGYLKDPWKLEMKPYRSNSINVSLKFNKDLRNKAVPKPGEVGARTVQVVDRSGATKSVPRREAKYALSYRDLFKVITEGVAGGKIIRPRNETTSSGRPAALRLRVSGEKSGLFFIERKGPLMVNFGGRSTRSSNLLTGGSTNIKRYFGNVRRVRGGLTKTHRRRKGTGFLSPGQSKFVEKGPASLDLLSRTKGKKRKGLGASGVQFIVRSTRQGTVAPNRSIPIAFDRGRKIFNRMFEEYTKNVKEAWDIMKGKK